MLLHTQLNCFQLNHSQPINFLFNDFKLNCLQLTHKSVLTGQIIQQADTPLAPLWRDKSSMTKPGCRYGWLLKELQGLDSNLFDDKECMLCG